MTEAPDPILLDVSPDGVAMLTLNRPAKRNAFDEWLIAGLNEALETLRGADHVRIVFLRGAGDDFSAGADHDWLARQGERTREDNEDGAHEMAKALKAMHDLPLFTVTLAQGHAMGLAAGLAAATDWVVATKDAQFRFAAVRMGLSPATIAPYVIEAVGVRAARGLLASAAQFGAQRAYDLGLVQEIVADAAGLDSAVKRLAGLAFENAPGAVADAKKLVREAAGRKIDDHLGKDNSKRVAERRASPEGREGVAALLAKRKPSWDGGA
jgi:methylglutaconyl-CoA hydratase